MLTVLLILIAMFVPLFATYYGVKSYVEYANVRRPGETEESWFGRQRDPSAAALIVMLLGALGAGVVMFSLHKWPRAVVSTVAFAMAYSATTHLVGAAAVIAIRFVES